MFWGSLRDNPFRKLSLGHMVGRWFTVGLGNCSLGRIWLSQTSETVSVRLAEGQR